MTNDDHDPQQVDTSLRLAPPCYFSRKSHNPPPPPPRWFLPGFFNGVDNDDVDTRLRLSPPGTVIPPPPPLVYNPTPLRWFRGGVDSPAKNSRNYSNKKGKRKLDDAETSAAADGGDDQKKKTKKRIRRPHDAEASTSDAAADEKKKRRRGDEEDQRRPLIPIGGLVRAVESRGGSRPEFLYKKKLEMSDVDKVQHRVFLSRGERVMNFLSGEEAAAVNGGGKGLTMVGVDGGGKVYDKLVMTKWESLRMIVINSDWNDVVAENEVKKDDVMEIWGYRENGKSCLAFNFRRVGEERDGDGGDNANHADAGKLAK